ncbi:hypothetical protein MRX96_021382 [Rhipicephalus microplus]
MRYVRNKRLPEKEDAFRAAAGGSSPDDPPLEKRPPRGSITVSAHSNGPGEKLIAGGRAGRPPHQGRPAAGNQHATAGWQGPRSKQQPRCRQPQRRIPTPPWPTPARDLLFSEYRRSADPFVAGRRTRAELFHFFVPRCPTTTTARGASYPPVS